MADMIKGLFGGPKPSASPVPTGDSDFADFAGAPDPSPASFSAIPTAASFTGVGAAPTGDAVPWTAWYNVHERHSLSEFRQEGVILGFLVVIIIVHVIGTSSNRKKARSWITAHGAVLKKEFALVGFGGPQIPTVDQVETDGLMKVSDSLVWHESLMKEKSPQEFTTYASGRQNIAFIDVNLALHKRYSPITVAVEFAMSLFFESMSTPAERVEAVLYPFDGRESTTVPGQVPGAHELRKDVKSSYDGFVWAVVNKDTMKQLRDDRYDVSLTSTKDSSKLPNWVTIMSESAEITDFLLTPELIKAIESAGELLEHLIITDQPIAQPQTLDETIPKKRVHLSYRIPSSGDYSKLMPIFEYFVCLTDILVQGAHFRAEVLRKVKSTREDAIKRLQKADEDEKAEERALEREKSKKVKRDLELKGLDAKAQKKYLEKEKEREMKKMQKKQTQRG
ncbi:putative UPF0674 endoplasmic reticulum membrane protein [Amylocarpus encephaloides]|uniref:UPF0674 endoplasmic reticulum membrane protein n=1 Tax=Amylocarpus encephaloides TaxID=45428 RepID=A0A9P8C0N3_9HELO|nr:putative UPF0674 endoplasmic reticulum membrane protein [Amylocarpus encephaloides]